MRNRKRIRFLLYTESSFEDGTLPSDKKSMEVRKAYESLRIQTQGHLHLPPLDADRPLMDALGAISLGLIARDAEGYEIMIPLSMFDKSNFEAYLLFTFEQSASRLLTIGSVHQQMLTRNVLDDHALVTRHLEAVLRRNLQATCSDLVDTIRHAVICNYLAPKDESVLAREDR